MDGKITDKAVKAKEVNSSTRVRGTRKGIGTGRVRTQLQRLADDVFLAATVGNSEWLDSSLRIKCASGSVENANCFDENVSPQ